MGTNYYVTNPTLGLNEYHVGKSSGGWVFSLHCEEEDVFTHSWQSWRDVFYHPDTLITSEYDEFLSPDAMEQIITNRSWHRQNVPTADFLRLNGAKLGPNGLLMPDPAIRMQRWGRSDDNPSYVEPPPSSATWGFVQGQFS